MKKIIYILMMVLMCSFVFAQNGNSQMAQNQVTSQEQVREQNREQARNMIQLGLENSLNQMTDSQAKNVLEKNMERFEERVQSRLHIFSSIEVTEVNKDTGEVRIRARERLKLLGILPVELTKEFRVDEEGNVKEEMKWYYRFFKE